MLTAKVSLPRAHCLSCLLLWENAHPGLAFMGRLDASLHWRPEGPRLGTWRALFNERGSVRLPQEAESQMCVRQASSSSVCWKGHALPWDPGQMPDCPSEQFNL